MLNRFLLPALLLASTLSHAGGKNKVLGCWEDRTTHAHLYLTRDDHFVLMQEGKDTLKGDWIYHTGPGTLELKYTDRAATKLIMKRMKSEESYFVDRNAAMKFYQQGQGPCK